MQCTTLCFMFSSQVINKKLAKHLKEMKLFLVLRNLNKYTGSRKHGVSVCISNDRNEWYLPTCKH